MPDSTEYDLLLDRLANNASITPNKTAFSFLSSGVNGGSISASVTYQELQQQTSDLAQRLLKLGLTPGDRALLVYPPSLDYAIAFLACLKAGIVAVPVFPPHPARNDTLKMFGTITASCTANVALTNKEYNHLKKLSSVKDAFAIKFKASSSSSTKWPDHLQWIVTDDKTTNSIDNNKKDITAKTSLPASKTRQQQPSDLAFLQYTSGSTSEPKGVMITHGNLGHNLTIITNELKAKDDTVVVSWLPQYHDMGLIGSYLGVLYCGGSGYYLSPLSFLQRPMVWIEAVSKHRATHLQAPNFAFKLTARKFRASEYVNQPLQLQSVRHIINAAEPVDEVAMSLFYKAFGPFGLREDVIFPTYGLAEHTVFVCSGGRQTIQVWKEKLQVEGIVQVIEDEANVDAESVSTLVGCGYPSHQRVDVRIVDRETCQQLSAGKVGEIWVSSPSKAAGYFGKPTETKEDFEASIIASSDGDTSKHNAAITYLRTGDLGFLHNDELFICGRLKDLIIVAGRNYYPQDIEATAEATSDLLRPGCSAAFTIDSTRQGGEEVALVMELRSVPPSKAEISKICDPLAKQVRSAVNQEHSLGISQVLFLKTKTVPKTSSGKIARAWCRKGYLVGTLQIVYQKSFPKANGDDTTSTSFEIDGNGTHTTAPPPRTQALTKEEIDALRTMSRDEIMDKLRLDVARTAQIPPDSIDNDTALVTILDSMSISQFKGRLEGAYGVQISDEYLFGERVTLKKLAEVVKLGYAPDDTRGDDVGSNGVQPPSSAPTGKAEGLAGVLGCPPGVKVCCVIQ